MHDRPAGGNRGDDIDRKGTTDLRLNGQATRNSAQSSVRKMTIANNLNFCGETISTTRAVSASRTPSRFYTFVRIFKVLRRLIGNRSLTLWLYSREMAKGYFEIDHARRSQLAGTSWLIIELSQATGTRSVIWQKERYGG